MANLLVVGLCIAIALTFFHVFFEKRGFWIFLGFLIYPFLFVPLLLTFAPGVMEWWIHVYAEYLRIWGI